MQLFVRDVGTVVLQADSACTVHQLKAMFTQKAYGVETPVSWVRVRHAC